MTQMVLSLKVIYKIDKTFTDATIKQKIACAPISRFHSEIACEQALLAFLGGERERATFPPPHPPPPQKPQRACSQANSESAPLPLPICFSSPFRATCLHAPPALSEKETTATQAKQTKTVVLIKLCHDI